MPWSLKKKCLDILSLEEGHQKKIWGDVTRICLVYPNYYRTGMSNLGFQTIYALINRHPSFVCERVFLPDPEDEEVLTSGSIPLFSLESQKSVADFDLVAFSIPFENDYLNILRILNLAGITLLAGQRKETEPLIIGGGFSVTMNPEPLADFFDIFLLGEGEEILSEFLNILENSRHRALPREDILLRTQREIEGAYVPRFYEVIYGSNRLIECFKPTDKSLPDKIKKRWITDINAFVTEQCLTTVDTEFGGVFLIEVSRGCRRGCRFCAAGFLCRPPRFRDERTLEPSITRAVGTGRKVGLLGTAVSDHPDLISLCRSILAKEGKVAIGSLRLDRIDKDIASLLQETGVKTVSLAPEAGTQRLRDFIHKGITEIHIYNAIELLLEHGITDIRLYFMLGLPTETEHDIAAIIDLVKRIKHQAVKSSAGKRKFRLITLSVNQFIPKAVTPFQWYPLEDVVSVRKKMRKIGTSLRKEASIKVIHDLPKWSYIQALLSVGDRRIGQLLLCAHRYKGNWAQAFKEVNVNPDFYVYRKKGIDEVFPWDFIDHGVSKQLLIKEFKKASV